MTTPSRSDLSFGPGLDPRVGALANNAVELVAEAARLSQGASAAGTSSGDRDAVQLILVERLTRAAESLVQARELLADHPEDRRRRRTRRL